MLETIIFLILVQYTLNDAYLLITAPSAKHLSKLYNNVSDLNNYMNEDKALREKMAKETVTKHFEQKIVKTEFKIQRAQLTVFDKT